MENPKKGVTTELALPQSELRQVECQFNCIEKINVILKRKYNKTVVNTAYKIPLSLLCSLFKPFPFEL